MFDVVLLKKRMPTGVHSNVLSISLSFLIPWQKPTVPDIWNWLTGFHPFNLAVAALRKSTAVRS